MLTWSFSDGCEHLPLCGRQHPAQSRARRGLQSVVGEWMDRWPDCSGFTVIHAFLASVQVSEVVRDLRHWVYFRCQLDFWLLCSISRFHTVEWTQNKWLWSLSVSHFSCGRQRGVCPDLRMSLLSDRRAQTPAPRLGGLGHVIQSLLNSIFSSRK